MTAQAEDQAKQDEQPKRGRQSKQEDQAKQDDDHLVAMTKAGESIKVHPSCVAAHERAGWAQG